MTFLDRVRDGLDKITPRSGPPKSSLSGGIGSGGHVGFEDDMIISKPAIVFHASQIFFNFLAMACFASVAAFQAKWNVGPSGLTGFTLFLTISGMLFSAFMLAVPVAYEKYDKFVRLARGLKEVRVGFILTGTGTTASLLIAFIVTISAWTQAGCKNADNDPHAEEKGDDFKKGLPGWCNTKKAAAIFLWLAFVFWGASLVLLILQWRQGKLLGPRDPPFQHPTDDDAHEDDDEESSYHHIPPVQPASTAAGTSTPPNPFTDSNRYSAVSSAPSSAPYSTAYSSTPVAAGRPSMDAYGAFSDPAPSGFGSNTPTRMSGAAPTLPEPDLGPQVSRTMQYADPYAAIRANIQQTSGAPTSSPYGAASSVPPSYESYTGYR